MSNKINEDLFKTNAVRVAPEQKPFWYTSGRLGPFYINTHFIVKDEENAVRLLKNIESYIAEDKLTAPKKIFDDMLAMYETSDTFRNCIDELVNTAKEFKFDYISGGERRDFFFSMLPAYLLKVPHLTIYKDMSAVYTSFDMTEPVEAGSADLNGKKALHIADLITEASSYERAWIPVIRGLGSDITDTIAVVDRHQNGRAVLEGLGVNMVTLTGINRDLFEEAQDKGVINAQQKELVMSFLDSPEKYMDDFLKAHPDFIAGQIELGGKAKERAELAISKGFAKI